jgi:hypothetical protein
LTSLFIELIRSYAELESAPLESLSEIVAKCYGGILPSEQEILHKVTEDIPAKPEFADVREETHAGFKNALSILKAQRAAQWTN